MVRIRFPPAGSRNRRFPRFLLHALPSGFQRVRPGRKHEYDYTIQDFGLGDLAGANRREGRHAVSGRRFDDLAPRAAVPPRRQPTPTSKSSWRPGAPAAERR
jgi:hypothetical protein